MPMEKVDNFFLSEKNVQNMNKYAFLIGSAKKSFRQKKLCNMETFLQTEEGGSLPEKNICIFPGGINELLMEKSLK